MLYLLGFDLLTGVFVLTLLALIDKRPGVTLGGVLKNWGWCFTGNFLGALTVAVMMSIVFTYGFSTEPNKVGNGDRQHRRIAHAGVCPVRCGRHVDAVHPWHAVQLDGVDRRRRGDDLDDRQRQLIAVADADPPLLRHGPEPRSKNMFPPPVRPDHGRQVLDHGLPDLERDSDDGPRQPGGRPRLYRPHAVQHASEDRREAQLQLIAGCGGAGSGGRRRPFGREHVQRTENFGRPAHSDKGRKEINQDFYGVFIPQEPQLSARGCHRARRRHQQQRRQPDRGRIGGQGLLRLLLHFGRLVGEEVGRAGAGGNQFMAAFPDPAESVSLRQGPRLRHPERDGHRRPPPHLLPRR